MAKGIVPHIFLLYNEFINKLLINMRKSRRNGGNMNQIEQMMKNVEELVPLVHFMTNYVTVNDCANMCLACNGSPIMSDDIDDVKDIVSICSSLVLNIGTLNDRTIRSMLEAGRRANELGKPVLFDPVGAGASRLRDETVKMFMKELEFTVIKGNISEIKNLFGGFTDTKGVDAAAADLVNEDNLQESIRFARELSIMSGAVIVITGPIDIISDSTKTFICRNGHWIMPKITGTGCMMGGVIAAYIAANPEHILEAAALATAAMGVCGELAYEKMEERDAGTGTFHSLFIDEMSKLNASRLEKYIRLEELGGME